jgi:pSer/pThr/pTyr-binding forkhead associated (FHA) protein
MGPVHLLEVRSPGVMREYLLNGQPVSLGRAADNSVVLDSSSVSRHHARIDWALGQPQLTDLGSANGTFVNGARLEANIPTLLTLADRIMIVDFEMALREPVAGQASRKDVSSQSLPGDRSALLVRAEPAELTLSIRTSDGEKTHVLREAQIAIGRDPASDITIDAPVVSRHHARMEQVAGGYQIVDLGSSNGLTCRDVQVSQMRLADGDVIWIGTDVSMTYQIAPATAGVPEAEPLAAETPAPSEAALPGADLLRPRPRP